MIANEPQLTPDELVGVRGLLQERYGSLGFRPCEACTRDDCAEVCPHLPENDCGLGPNAQYFASAVASLADANNSPGACCVNASVREDKQQENVTSSSRLPADPHKTSCEREHCLCKTEWRHGLYLNRTEHERAAAEHLTPVEAANRRLADHFPQFASPPVASAAGSSPSEDVGTPQPPSEGCPVTVVTDSRRAGFAESVIEQALQGDCYDQGADDAAAEWIGKAVAAICEVLAEHRPAVDYTGVYCNTNSDDGPHHYYENWAAWREHVAPLIVEAVAPYWIGW